MQVSPVKYDPIRQRSKLVVTADRSVSKRGQSVKYDPHGKGGTNLFAVLASSHVNAVSPSNMPDGRVDELVSLLS